MQKNILFFLLVFINAFTCRAQDSIQARIVVIGDAGQFNYGREPVIDAARDWIPLDEKTTVLYIGDNLYTAGLPDDMMPGYEKAKSILDSQINIANGTKAKVLFIPGNHDWDDMDNNGLAIVQRQGEYINAKGGNIKFLPTDGCPGPVEYPINDNIVMVVFDSQWFIRPDGRKPGIESDCPFKTTEQFYAELNDILNRNSKKLIILACHHTMKSYGIHGGYFPLKTHIFPLTDIKPNLWIPLPVLGSVYPIARGVFGISEDLHYPAYANMISNVERIARQHSNIIFVAGHEHTLQLIKDSSFYYVVSGAGSKSTRVSYGRKTVFKAQSFGFATLEISKNKNVHIDYYTVSKDSVSHAFSKNLFNFSAIKNELSDSTSTPQATPVFSFKDSVTVAINENYNKVSSVHKLFAGKNYRKEWSTPVHLKVFNINKENGGYKIISLGGSAQSESLKLLDKNNQQWILQTVDKIPSGSAEEALKAFVPKKILQDMISAQHPYAPLVVPTLADAANIVHADPKYFFVPDDPSLGFYRSTFANKICLLEILDPTSDETETISTSQLVNKILSDNKNHVDQEAILRSRLLDMMIGDWDRHFDQWRFGASDTGLGKLYYPIPRGRDQAFYYSDGFFVKSTSIAAAPYLQGFRKSFPNIKWFNWEERYFDRVFMNDIDENKWKRSIEKFQHDESDSVIDDALKNLPKEIYKTDAVKIGDKLKSRRNELFKDGLKYYRFLSKEVNVTGSNRNEYFKVSGKGDSLEVKVYKRTSQLDSLGVMFDRVFNASVTKYINLYGLNGNDIFEIDSTAHSKIKVRIIGGKGRDTFNIHGNVRNIIYDFKNDSNFIIHAHNTRNKISDDADANAYSITDFNYNTYRLPLINIAYNTEDRTIAGLGYSLKTYAFRKDPYSTYQQLTSVYSFLTQKFQVHYSGVFNEVIAKYDLVAKGDLYNSVLNNFFGFGNDTKIDKSKPRDFYNVQYNYLSADLLLRKRYHDLLEFNLGSSYYQYYNSLTDNKNKILAQPSAAGLDSADVYSNKSYAGIKASLIIHNVADELLPTRGIYWNTEFSSLFGINKSHQITKLTSDMTVYASFNDPAKFVTVLRLGYGHIFNENYEYFQALDLGQNNYLHGFLKNRFTGKSLLYESTEFRLKLFESNSYIVPGTVGLLAFNDIGKVYIKDQTSHSWHDSYGGGFYFSPYNFALISTTIAFSGEGNIFNFSIGTKFNLTF